jgi:carboxypeptidase PM20D1
MILDSPMSGITGRYGVIGIMEKGYGDVRFTAAGEGGHASTPPEKTPVTDLAAFITRIQKKSPFKSRISRPVREMFTCMAPHMSFGMRYLFGNLWLFGGLLRLALPMVSREGAALLHTTCVFTMLSGSEASNIIPRQASAVANLRFMPYQDKDESVALLNSIALRYGITAEFLVGYAASPAVEVKGAAFQSFTKILSGCFPDVGFGPYVMLGGTDAYNFCPICDNVLRFAPFYIDDKQYKSIHAADENISVSSLADGVACYKTLIERFV